jgi:hypothetical protein
LTSTRLESGQISNQDQTFLQHSSSSDAFIAVNFTICLTFRRISSPTAPKLIVNQSIHLINFTARRAEKNSPCHAMPFHSIISLSSRNKQFYCAFGLSQIEYRGRVKPKGTKRDSSSSSRAGEENMNNSFINNPLSIKHKRV